VGRKLAPRGDRTADRATGSAPRKARDEDVEVRPARPEDLGAIGELLARYAPLGLVRARAPEELRRELGGFLVAVVGVAAHADARDDGVPGGEVIGCTSLRVHSPALAELASLAVAEGWHGRGIASRLVEAAVLRAHAGGARRIFAFTQRPHLFERAGFRVTSVSEFPEKVALDYGGFTLVAPGKSAVVLDLEGMPGPGRRGMRIPATGARPDDSVDPQRSRRRSDVNRPDAAHKPPLAILGTGNLGRALAMGWVEKGHYEPFNIWITRRNADKLAHFADAGFRVGSDNLAAVKACDIVLVAVQPQQVAGLLEEIRPGIDPARHRIFSVVSGVTIKQIRERLGGSPVPIVRVMPNTAVAIGESMTCLSAQNPAITALTEARELFDLVGRTLVIPEEMMIPATALCACGVAFFLRAIRAASQGGIEIGFAPEDALLLAAQTAKGAAALLLSHGRHPESEIDRVTTPRGCTIAGLNEMEHQGFSSALIKGILISASTAEGLYRSE
jgi:pyrroline-5-carboxylate reductase